VVLVAVLVSDRSGAVVLVAVLVSDRSGAVVLGAVLVSDRSGAVVLVAVPASDRPGAVVLVLDGLVLDGLVLDGLVLDGLVLDGLVLDGLVLDGLVLDGDVVEDVVLLVDEVVLLVDEEDVVLVVDVVLVLVLVLVLVVVGGGTSAHSGRLMTLLSRVTAPLRASRRPSTVAPMSAEMDVKARMVPWKAVRVPSVAEDDTCQKTLQGLAPLMRLTALSVAVIRVLSVLMMKTAAASPPASRVRVPVMPSVAPV
jgi:hypothetical protein